MDHDPDYNKANVSPDSDDRIDISMDFTGETTLDEILYGRAENPQPPAEETPSHPEEPEAFFYETDPPAETEPARNTSEAFQDHVPEFEASARSALTGKEVLLYLGMIGVLVGVVWWIMQEMKQLGTLQTAQARVGVNTKLLPPRKTAASTEKAAEKKASKPAAGKMPAVAGTPQPGDITNLLIGLLGFKIAPGHPAGNSSEQEARERHQALLNDLENITSDTPWMDRTVALLPTRSDVPADVDVNSEFWEDPFLYGKIRVNQSKRSANNTTKVLPKIETVDKRFVLNGIMVVDGQPTAVINGRHVRAGDRIGDAKVLQIGTFSVTLEINAVKHTLRL